VDTRDELFASILDAAANIKEGEDQPDEQNAIFSHELQSALRVTVGIFRKFIVNCNEFFISV
jgi:hypothetical protein